MKEKGNTTLFLIVFVLILGFAFYWYSYRPEQIRKQCYKETKYNLGLLYQNYENCLLRNGLDANELKVNGDVTF